MTNISANELTRRHHLQFAYLIAVETDVKTVFSFEPSPLTTVIMATEIPAAINPYSMAVAAVSSW
jgi:hypothetical protein